jgi:hypothetical protein
VAWPSLERRELALRDDREFALNADVATWLQRVIGCIAVPLWLLRSWRRRRRSVG